MVRRPFWRNPVFWIGAGLMLGAVAYAWIGDPMAPMQQLYFGVIPPELGADGRCTGFPNGLGRWQWGHCCVEHDAGGSDVDLFGCLLKAVPIAAGPLAAFGVGLMMSARPIYNQLQRWGWVR